MILQIEILKKIFSWIESGFFVILVGNYFGWRFQLGMV